MREIKFRAWLKEYEQMGYPSHLKVGHPEGVFEITIPFNDSLKTFRKLYSTDEFDLMQYTGLKDKNGKEIYEGDIVKHDFWGEYIIVFIDGMFIAKDKYEKDDFLIKEYQNNIEIIGDIHQNPELVS